MLRLLFRSRRWLSVPPRRQNFFELNPIFPDQGQKDFDIYNVDYNHVLSGQLSIKNEERHMQMKHKLTRQVYLAPTLQKTYGQKKSQYEIDEEFGFPVGMHQDFDNFIAIFKREKKVGSNVVGQFQDLVMSLMRKFQAKSEIELIKIFRFNLAKIQKDNFKDKMRALLINSAFIRFLKERKNQGLANDSLTLSELTPFLDQPPSQEETQNRTSDISQKELEEILVSQTLKDLDEKIAKVEEDIQAKAVADGTFIPTYHPRYGMAIRQESQTNLKYDLNFPLGFSTSITSNEPLYTSYELQERQIESRLNKLFFAEVLNRIQQKKTFEPEDMIDIHNLPMNIRSKDKIINQLLYKYKEHDLLVEPDLKEIYKEIDMTLKKIAVKVVPNYLDNEKENGQDIVRSSEVRERIVTKDALLWRQLDVEEVFDPQYYNEDKVNKVKVEQREIEELTPSAVMELTLNKVPFNLYRHADLENFSVFNKYRKKVYADYLSDRVIDPEVEFKFFSLESAQKGLTKIKKPQEIADKFYGYGKRKSSEAEVFVTPGTGKVIINKQPLADYFGDVYHRGETLKPLIFTETAGKYDLEFTVVGGGLHSQSECMAIALTQALIAINPRFQTILASFGLVGIDDRKKEPKRIGLYSARVRPPYVRR